MTQNQIDLRKLAPEERHTAVFRVFDSLTMGEEFMLVVDHDPKPLFRQFRTQRPGAFHWEYTEQGPQLWQVRIAKTSDKLKTEEPEEGCCGICGTN